MKYNTSRLRKRHLHMQRRMVQPSANLPTQAGRSKVRHAGPACIRTRLHSMVGKPPMKISSAWQHNRLEPTSISNQHNHDCSFLHSHLNRKTSPERLLSCIRTAEVTAITAGPRCNAGTTKASKGCEAGAPAEDSVPKATQGRKTVIAPKC